MWGAACVIIVIHATDHLGIWTDTKRHLHLGTVIREKLSPVSHSLNLVTQSELVLNSRY